MVYVAIHDERPLDYRFVLERANRDRNVMNGAEALAVCWKSVVKSTSDIDSDAIAQSVARG